ncbi:MAG: hypothetical protein AB1609_12715, partial [Bacillota bacterium]
MTNAPGSATPGSATPGGPGSAPSGLAGSGSGALRSRRPLGLRTASYGTFLGFLGVVALFSALRPDAFLSAINLRNILEQVAILAILTATMTIVMVAGDFDLSVGTLASLAGVVSATLLLGGVPVFGAVLA